MISLNPHPSMLRPTTGSDTVQVTLPHQFTPRDYQRDDLFRPLFPHHYPDLKVLATPRKKRICMVHHRRAGKDKSVINALTLAAWEELGNYLYLLPEQTQAKKLIWRGIGGDGIKFIDHIPQQIIKKKYESEMLVELTNGSTVQIGGSDNFNSWMGTNPRGIVLSEYSIQNPLAWQYFRPILAENGGWAVFIYTARGKNHGHDLYQIAKANPDQWACSLRTIEDTRRHDGSPVITQGQYKQELDDGMPEAMARQEFYCDFEAALVGSYYGDLMEKARVDERIGYFPHDPAQPVYTAWDLGNDANVVVFAQKDAGGLRIIDHYEEPDTPFTEVCKVVMEKAYTYGAHFAPHDVKNRDHESNTRINTARNFGIDFVVTPRGSRNDGIEAVRQLIPQVRFHEVECENLINSMRSYHRVFDDKLRTFREQPVHDFSSHTADAVRILASNWTDAMVDSSWLDKPLELDHDWVV